MERHLRADHHALTVRRRKALVPYALLGPGGLWLAVLFVVPMVAMLSVSLQTGNIDEGFRFTWNFSIYQQAVSLYHTQLLRSLLYGTIVMVSTLLVGYPVAYWTAFRAGRLKNTVLLVLLLPFLVSFVIRTLAWSFILSDEGFVLGTLKAWHLLPHNFHVLSTPLAVVSGIAYNGLPFMVLPLYVTLEKIDRSLVEAAKDLYASRARAFLHVVLPLSVPGIFAGVLLTFVPAVGDYINASILGGPGTTMIGNIIQLKYLQDFDYPLASALSFILMIGLMIGALAYAKVLGTRSIEEYV